MKKTSRLKAVSAGCYLPRSNLIPVHKLEVYLEHCPNQARLIRAIVYSMIKTLNERTSYEWQLAKKVLPFVELKEVCVFHLEPIRDFEDLIAVDFSVLNTPLKSVFFKAYPWLKVGLLLELSLVK